MSAEQMHTPLKPCPFCGGSDFTFREDDERNLNSVVTWHELRCDSPDCCSMMRYPSRDGVIAAWNRRAPAGAQEADWLLVPRKPSATQLEQAASNLADEFGADFVLANKQFALAVYDEMLAAAPVPPASQAA